jgi:hypothetical protein
VTGTLLVGTAFGFELAADSRSRDVLAALGVSARSRAGIVGVELGVVSLYGAALGVAVWAVVGLVLRGAFRLLFDAPVVGLDPRFAVYGFAVAAGIGLLSLPYLLLLGSRSGTGVSP